MEELDYLIRSLTYKRSCLELELKKIKPFDIYTKRFIEGQIDGLSIAISELFKLTMQQMEMENKHLGECQALHRINENN